MRYRKKAKVHRLQGMNRFFGIVLILFGMVVILPSACGKGPENNENIVNATTEIRETVSAGGSGMPQVETSETFSTNLLEMQPIMIEANGQSFRAVLQDNEAAKAFAGRFPMTLTMGELNGNEKYYYMEEGLPTDAQKVGSVRAGDIMLFGSDCLVLFFENFRTSYSYTPIGFIEDGDGFVNALTVGTVEVTFREDTDQTN